MKPVSYVSEPQHRPPAPDMDVIDASSVSLLKDLFDPTSNLTPDERGALVLVMKLLDRRIKEAGIL